MTSRNMNSVQSLKLRKRNSMIDITSMGMNPRRSKRSLEISWMPRRKNIEPNLQLKRNSSKIN